MPLYNVAAIIELDLEIEADSAEDAEAIAREMGVNALIEDSVFTDVDVIDVFDISDDDEDT